MISEAGATAALSSLLLTVNQIQVHIFFHSFLMDQITVIVPMMVGLTNSSLLGIGREFAYWRPTTAFAGLPIGVLAGPVLLLEVGVRNRRKGIFIHLFHPQVVQTRDETLLLAGTTTGLFLDAGEAGQAALVVCSVRCKRRLGSGLLWVLLHQPRLILRAAEHLLPVDGSLLALGQLPLLRNTVLPKLIV